MSTTLLQSILNTEVPTTLRISPNGQHVVYLTRRKLNHKNSMSEPGVAALWIADTATPASARPLTDGKSFDWMPEWSPDGDTISFLSNRAKSQDGKRTCGIYLQGRSNTVARAVLATGRDSDNGESGVGDFTSISRMAFRADGRSIAFIAAQPYPKLGKDQKDSDNENDAVVWRKDESKTNFQCLWLVDVLSGAVSMLTDGNTHVTDFVWCDDGDLYDFAVMTQRSTHADSSYLYGTDVSLLKIGDRQLHSLCHIPRIVWSPVWLHSALFFISNNTPDQDTSGMSVFRVQVDQTAPQEQSLARVFCGESDCAVGLVRAGRDIVVHVEHGLEDRLHLLLAGDTIVVKNCHIVDYHASGTAKQDVHVVLSWGTINKPTEVFSIVAGTKGTKHLQLSDHGHVLSREPLFGFCHRLSCSTLDNQEELDNLYLAPAVNLEGGDATIDAGDKEDELLLPKPANSLPTFVLLHGGPYCRRTNTFDSYDPFSLLIQPLLREGYGILIVNYRGGSSRGERFASYARGGMGIYDEPDIVASIQAAINRGFADPARLVAGGWSQGGYLAYLSAVRNGEHGLGWRFSGIVAGAGITDWDSMTLTSDVGAGYESQFAGGVPWKMAKSDVRTRSGSALWEFKEAVQKRRIPPILMLHGERDVRVPISQAWGFQRALDEADLPFSFVTYPREGHVLREKKHIIDALERIMQFVRDHLSK